MKYEKNSKPPKCPIFSLILNFKIRPMGLKKKHESSRQNTSKMQVQISKREPTWTNVKREPTWNMKVHAKNWLRFMSGSRFTSVHVSRENQTWHVGWGMRVYVYLLPPKKRKLKIPAIKSKLYTKLSVAGILNKIGQNWPKKQHWRLTNGRWISR